MKKAKEVWDKLFPFEKDDYVRFKAEGIKRWYYGWIAHKFVGIKCAFSFRNMTQKGNEPFYRILLAEDDSQFSLVDIPEHYLQRAKRRKDNGKVPF